MIQLYTNKAKTNSDANAKLEKLANQLIEKETAKLQVNRSMNTARRASMAASAFQEAEREIALAQTIKRIVEARKNSYVYYLDGLKAKSHFETLERLLTRAKYKSGYKQGQHSCDIECRDTTEADLNSVEYPYPTFNLHHLNKLVEVGSNIEAAKKVADEARKLVTTCGSQYVVKVHSKEQIEYVRELAKHVNGLPNTREKYSVERILDDIKDYDRLQIIGLTTESLLSIALREYLNYRSEKPKPNQLRILEQSLIGQRIPGYFPTPRAIIDQMLDKADIRPNQSLLEPNGGRGNILDAIRENYPEVKLATVEINQTLRAILVAKGHDLVGQNFLEHKEYYDRIIMNPPFEEGQYIDHIMQAYQLLNPGGRLVSILPHIQFDSAESLQSSGRKKLVDFGDFLAMTGAEIESLPEKAFLASENPTAVRTSLIVIDKPETF